MTEILINAGNYNQEFINNAAEKIKKGVKIHKKKKKSINMFFPFNVLLKKIVFIINHNIYLFIFKIANLESQFKKL